MCGIYGVLSARRVDLEGVRKRMARISYRGPDNEAVWSNDAGNVALAHRRLSIIDLSKRHDQPLTSSCGRYTIVYNGELYNFESLRAELESLGYVFKTKGDTEVVLISYIHWGEDCLEKFNGMFAFAIYYEFESDCGPTVFLARDRLGKKPLYYHVGVEGLEFASELKLISKNEGVDLEGINYFLALGYVPNEHCIAKGVKKLEPGCCATYRFTDHTFQVKRYWSLPLLNVYEEDVSIADHAETCWGFLKDSTSLRMRSDVPIGLFLSGGLDSSLITAAAAHVESRRVKTFTVALPDSELDESGYANQISDYFDTEHVVLNLNPADVSTIEEILPLIDEPLADSSIIPSYLICKLTRKHAKVALGGDGGDELFGGYRHYQNVLNKQYLDNCLLAPFTKVLAKGASCLPAGIRGRNYLASNSHGAQLSHIWGGPYFDPVLRRRVLSKDAFADLGESFLNPENRLSKVFQSGSCPLDGLMRMDMAYILPDDFLVKVDRSSMYNSLEVRSPFLDYRLVEYCFSRVSPDQKVKKDERRRIQNEMAKRYLPKSFKLNRKQGFSIPVQDWLKRIDLFQYLESLPCEIFNLNEVESLIEGQSKGRSNSARLFGLVMLSASFKNVF